MRVCTDGEREESVKETCVREMCVLLLSACSDISVHREREQEGDVDGRGQRREDGGVLRVHALDLSRP